MKIGKKPQNGKNSHFKGTENGTSGVHFSIQTSPQNSQKATSGTKIEPRKVIFGHFINLFIFLRRFPISTGRFFQMHFQS